MDELDPQTRRLLDAARPMFSPSPQELASLRERLGDPPPDGGGGGGAGGTPAALWVVVAVTIVLAVGVGLALRLPPGVGARAKPMMPSLQPGASAPASAPEVDDGSSREPADVTAQPPEDRVRDEPPSPTTRTGPSKPAAAPPDPRSSTRDPPAPPQADLPESLQPKDPGGPSLTEELELLVRSRQAVRASQWKRVRALHREHTRRFPQGSFAEESAVLDLVAACSLHADGAQERAWEYLSASPRFASRVEAACAVGADP